MATNRNRDDIDYTAEGTNPPREKNDPTSKGYDEAVRSGPGRYGVPEGEGGVFGTSGGGTYGGGLHPEERPAVGVDEEEGVSRRTAGGTPIPDDSTMRLP